MRGASPANSIYRHRRSSTRALAVLGWFWRRRGSVRSRSGAARISDGQGSIGLQRSGSRAQGLKARVSRSSVKRIKSLPVIACGHDGAFFVIGRLIKIGALIGHAGGPPVAWTLEQLAEAWTGEMVLVAKRDRLPGEVHRFGLRWFVPVIKRFSKVLAQVLSAALEPVRI